jgi:hypothetical protein
MDLWILEVKKRLLNGCFKSLDFTYYSCSNVILALKLRKHFDQACEDIFSLFAKKNPDFFQKILFD